MPKIISVTFQMHAHLHTPTHTLTARGGSRQGGAGSKPLKLGSLTGSMARAAMQQALESFMCVHTFCFCGTRVDNTVYLMYR